MHDADRRRWQKCWRRFFFSFLLTCDICIARKPKGKTMPNDFDDLTKSARQEHETKAQQEKANREASSKAFEDSFNQRKEVLETKVVPVLLRVKESFSKQDVSLKISKNYDQEHGKPYVLTVKAECMKAIGNTTLTYGGTLEVTAKEDGSYRIEYTPEYGKAEISKSLEIDGDLVEQIKPFASRLIGSYFEKVREHNPL